MLRKEKEQEENGGEKRKSKKRTDGSRGRGGCDASSLVFLWRQKTPEAHLFEASIHTTNMTQSNKN